MSSDIERRLIRVERLTPIYSGWLDAAKQVLGNVSQQVLSFSGGSYFGGSQDTVFIDPACGIGLPAKMLLTLFWGFHFEFSQQIDLNWNGSSWTSCTLLNWPGIFAGNARGSGFEFYIPAYAVDTPFYFEMVPPNPLVPAYQFPAQILIGNVASPAPVAGGTITAPVAGDCSGLNYVLAVSSNAVVCRPWSVSGFIPWIGGAYVSGFADIFAGWNFQWKVTIPG